MKNIEEKIRTKTGTQRQTDPIFQNDLYFSQVQPKQTDN